MFDSLCVFSGFSLFERMIGKKMVGKAAKRRQEAEIAARRERRSWKDDRGRSRKWNDAAPSRVHDFLRESTKATGIALLSGLSISMGRLLHTRKSKTVG